MAVRPLRTSLFQNHDVRDYYDEEPAGGRMLYYL